MDSHFIVLLIAAFLFFCFGMLSEVSWILEIDDIVSNADAVKYMGYAQYGCAALAALFMGAGFYMMSSGGSSSRSYA